MGFIGVSWTQRLVEAYLPSSYTWGRPLEPLNLLSNLPRDVGLGFHSALVHHNPRPRGAKALIGSTHSNSNVECSSSRASSPSLTLSPGV